MEGVEVAERSILALSNLSVDDLERRIFEGNESGQLGELSKRLEESRFSLMTPPDVQLTR